MKKNMGSADRIIRLIIAAIIVVLYFTKVISGTLGIILVILAVILLLTSFIAVCPLYIPLKLNTCSSKEKENK